MTTIRNLRWTALSAVFMAALPGCGVLELAGLDPNLEINLPEGFDVGATITLNGVTLLDNPELDTSAAQDIEVGSRKINDPAGKASADLAKVQVTRMRVSKNPANVNDTVTFTGGASGGTGRYRLFWWLEGDSAWTRGNGTWSFTRKVTKTPEQLLYFAVVDTDNNQSGTTKWKIKVKPNCQSIRGTSSMPNDNRPLIIVANETIANVFVASGSYKGGLAKISLTRSSQPEPGCDGCWAFDGEWSDEENGQVVGGLRMVFNAKLDRYDAYWKKVGDTAWRGSWSGSRISCDVN